MNELTNLISCYKNALSIDAKNEAEKIRAKFELEKQLLSSNLKEVLDFQYECLGDTSDKVIYQTCRAVFAKRKDIEDFLLTKLSSENEKHKKADVIHILGRIRSKRALDIAKENLGDDDLYLREVCLYVIGWTGGVAEVSLLAVHLGNESANKLRITSGSALRQIAWRIPEAKNDILKALKVAFYSEKDREVISRIIELTSTIAVKNLGIREDKNDPNILLGDLEKALVKARKYFESI